MLNFAKTLSTTFPAGLTKRAGFGDLVGLLILETLQSVSAFETNGSVDSLGSIRKYGR
jgi:hypothetical protein